jgi:hypothetical protein
LRETALALGVSFNSVANIAHKELAMNCFRHVPVQSLNDRQMARQHARAMHLLDHHREHWRRTVCSDEKMWYGHPPMNGGNDRFWSDVLKRNVASEQIIQPAEHYGPAVG